MCCLHRQKLDIELIVRLLARCRNLALFILLYCHLNQSLLITISHIDVPYAWFEKAGPVLYVNRSKWPFPTPFHVTGSDRSDRSNKSLTPRLSHWMPYTRTFDSVAVKGAVLDQNVLGWLGQTPECFQFRVDTIRWIQDQLQDPVSSISNATIGAIMTFTMWTVSTYCDFILLSEVEHNADSAYNRLEPFV